MSAPSTRAAAEALHRALAQRLGIFSPGAFDQSPAMPWLLGAADQILDAAAAATDVQRAATAERVLAAAEAFTDHVGGPSYPDERQTLFGQLLGAVADHRTAMTADEEANR